MDLGIMMRTVTLVMRREGIRHSEAGNMPEFK